MTPAVSASPHPFREATPVDLPHLCELFERFRAESPYAQYGPAHPEVSTPFMARLVAAEDPDSVVLVVEDEGQLVGMIGLLVTLHPMSGERCATELFWYLEPEHRGRGAWLLRRAERWAMDHGATFILMVSPQSHAVDRLYEALGYAPGETSWYKSLDWFARHTPPVRARRIPHGIRVHDDVLPDPMAYRAMALQQRFQAVHDGAVTFQRMAPCAHPALPLWIVRQYPQLTPTLTFFRQGEVNQAEPHYLHTDASMGDWTGILYLNPDPPDSDGTMFWRHTASGRVESLLMTQEEAAQWFDEHNLDVWRCWHRVPAQFNRLVLFPAPLYHSRALRENYGQGDSARLIQVCFGTGDLS